MYIYIYIFDEVLGQNQGGSKGAYNIMILFSAKIHKMVEPPSRRPVKAYYLITILVSRTSLTYHKHTHRNNVGPIFPTLHYQWTVYSARELSTL